MKDKRSEEICWHENYLDEGSELLFFFASNTNGRKAQGLAAAKKPHLHRK